MRIPVTRVAIVSPQEVVVSGIETMLANHPERVAVVPVHQIGDESEPDVVVYDVIALAEGDGADLERLVQHTGSAILAIARDLRPDLGARAMALGADGFFSIGVDDKELLAAVESANTGWQEGDPGANPVVGATSDAPRLGKEVGLTDREIDVLTMITQGFTNQEIADRSYLSINSVKTYIRGAYRRISATTRSQAVVWCLQHGFPTEVEDNVKESSHPRG